MAYVLPYDCLQCMERCFCSPTKPTSSEFHQFLTKCLALSPNAVPLNPKLAEENRECFVILKKTGVLVQEGEQRVRFSSPMAERFYFKRLVSEFARFDPKSVRELVTKVLGSMSASALRASVDGSHGFPDEITFRQQLMRSIAVNTTYTCSICPELPRVFPAAATDKDERRGVVFFVNASQKWGLEFVFVDGGNAQDYTSQFAPGGRYAALQVDDYAVVDLRGNATGTVPDGVAPKEKLVSVFFKLGDFSRCQCVFGMEDTT